jgi:hypothetical protein
VAERVSLELPPKAAADTTYRLIVGWYDAGSGERLPVTGTGTDFAELGTVQR